MPFFPLEKTENLDDGYWQVFNVAGESLLLLQTSGTPHLIENRCGHFGVPLETGDLKDNTIVCSQHGISFDLETGQIANRPYENADPIKIFEISYQNDYLGVILND